MRKFKLASACIGLISATVLAPNVCAATPAVPFSATIAISETLQQPGSAGCVFVGDISGTGQATQLGKMTLASRDCVVTADGTVFSFASTQVVLTAANGDQIFATYSGTLTAANGTIGAIVGGYTITGGTGRFSNAKGAGTVQGVEDITSVPAKGQIQLNGTISY